MSEPSLNDILGQLKKTEQKISIYIPSLKRDVEFKPITLAQQKQIIDKISTNTLGVVEFFNGVYELIAQTSSINVKEINVIDRFNIILHYRKNIGETYQEVNLSSLLEKNKNIQLVDLTKTITTDKFIFEVSVPSIVNDFKSNSYLLNNYKNETELLGKLMVNELSKFVNKITINETQTVIDFNAQTVKNKYTILETIESKHFTEVFQYISKVRDVEQEIVKFEDKVIDIGPELFIL